MCLKGPCLSLRTVLLGSDVTFERWGLMESLPVTGQVLGGDRGGLASLHFLLLLGNT